MKQPSYQETIAELTRLGCPFLHLPFFGVNIRKKNGTVDQFDDLLGFIDTKAQSVTWHVGTTDPGGYYLDNPEEANKNGVFILQPGFYHECWEEGLHKGKYPCWKQCAPLKGWRDNDGDLTIDPDTTKIFTDGAGVNQHSTREDITVVRVGKFSAGCQVRLHWADHEQLMTASRESGLLKWSLALLDQWLF